jgi:hypothetical protein
MMIDSFKSSKPIIILGKEIMKEYELLFTLKVSSDGTSLSFLLYVEIEDTVSVVF